ncbi:MAG: ornithine carbamoyltransferase [Thermoproteus sp.]
MFRGRDLLTLMEYKPEEVRALLEAAKEMKARYYTGEIYMPIHAGKTAILIFEKPSTRTRVSTSVAAYQLGMNVIVTNTQELQLGRGETVADTARTLSRYVHVIAARVYRHESLEELAQYAEVPVVNLLSDKFHPLQALADALTLWEKKGRLEGLKVAFVGDVGNNVAASLVVVGSKLGWEVRLVGPRRLWRGDLSKLTEDAGRTGARAYQTESLEDLKGVDAVYTDVWVSMGFEREAEEREKLLRPYQVDSRVMELAGPQALFMHCLPAHRGMEVTDDVIDGPRSVVWDQAENRLHTAKAVLAAITP